MKTTRTYIQGERIRARKVAGSYWLVYQLKNPDKPDYTGNREAIDMVPGKKAAIDYVKQLDDGPEEGEYDGEGEL